MLVFDYEILRLIWWDFLGLLIIGFALTGGFDLGIGALIPLLGRSDTERRVIINTIAPTWDGNQVWFITAAGVVFAAWPLVYSAVFSGLYVAFILTLFALFLRPVGFDYRSKLESKLWRGVWDGCLFIGGFVPAVVFGIAFGNLLLGLPFHFDDTLRVTYTGSFRDLLNPLGLLAGGISASMLILHGAVYLQWRTERVLALRAAHAARWAGTLLILFFAIAGVYLTLFVDGYQISSFAGTEGVSNPLAKTVRQGPGLWLTNYRDWPAMVFAPVMVCVGAVLAIFMSERRRPKYAFLASSMAIIGVILTAALSMFPFLVPSSTHPSHSLTVWDASSSRLTLQTMFWAVWIFLPLVIAYTTWAYKVMAGKVTAKAIEDDEHSFY